MVDGKKNIGEPESRLLVVKCPFCGRENEVRVPYKITVATKFPLKCLMCECKWSLELGPHPLKAVFHK